MDRLRQDLVFAFRLLWKDRAFALTTLLTLALCIGANTAIFTVVRSVLLRPLPYPEAGRLVSMYDSFPGAGVERAGTSVPNYFDRLALTDRARVAGALSVRRVSSRRRRERRGCVVDGGDAVVLPRPADERRARPAVHGGRGPAGASERVAVLSYTFAQRQPGGIDGIVGRDLRLDNELYTVVGVLPAGFHLLQSRRASLGAPRVHRRAAFRRRAATARTTRRSAGSRPAPR